MKLTKLSLRAYGHFTGKELVFTSTVPGLHIIHGPNEAGKSTALRALKVLLFGFPERTMDNFIHSYDQLLVGGCLENAAGEELTFYRRKKRVGDLLGSKMEQLNPARLAGFLQGIEPSLFDSLYGIDQETLVSGGRDILEQKGDVGQALFAAGAGLSSLHGIITDLERESADIFKLSGSKPELNRAIKEYNDSLKESRALSLSTSEWEQSRKGYETTIEELAATERQLSEQNRELARLKRILKALPKLAVRKELLARLAVLESMSTLPEDFPEQLHAIMHSRETITRRLSEERSRRTKLDEQRQGLIVGTEILAQEETIDSLHQRLGVERQARKDRPGLHEKMIRARTEAESLLRRVAPECELATVDTLKGVLGQRQSISRLGNRFQALEQSLLNARDLSRTVATSLTKAQSQLQGAALTAELLPLAVALTQATKAGHLDTVIRELSHECCVTRSTLEKQIGTLGYWNGTPEELILLKLPSNETVTRFLEQFIENDRDQKESRQKLRELREEHDQTQSWIKAMELTGHVVTNDDLIAARTGRELRWQLVRRIWLAGEDVAAEFKILDDGVSLPDAYEKSVRGTDEISDRLRSDAERVHTYAGHRAQLEKLALQITRWSETEQGAIASRDELEMLWKVQWQESCVTPATPKEMRDWLDRCAVLRRTAEELLVKESQMLPLCDQRKTLTQLLTHELNAIGKGRTFPGEELQPVLEYAGSIHDEINELVLNREKLQEEIVRLSIDHATAEEAVVTSQEALNSWRALWQEALQGLGLAEGSNPEDAAEALENLRSCLEQRDMARGFQQRIDEIDRHASDFENDATLLIKGVAPQLEGLPPEQAVVKLQGMLTETRKTISVLGKIHDDITQVDEEIRIAGVEQQIIDDAVTGLKQRVCCVDDDELALIESSFKEYLALRQESDQIHRGLLEDSEGIPLEIIEQQAAQVDPNELPATIDAVNRLIHDELEPRIKSLSEKKGAARIQLEQMDGSGRAAEMMEQAEAALAKVRRLAGRYVRLRIAGQVLKREIEQYRREHQDPVLRIASRYFTEMTCGAYEGLRTDVDDNGHPVIIGVTTDARQRAVEGMSSGTRDQLYLSLRLATLEWRLEKHQPMPFIADDLLVNFDDVRSAATLRVLSELGEKNQVILFTHHRQIVTIAEALGQKDRVFIHELGG